MDRAVSFGEISTYVFTHSCRVKHVVCSPSKVISPMDSLTVKPFS